MEGASAALSEASQMSGYVGR